MVLLFTAAAVAMLWGLNQRSQAELRTQVLDRAVLRSAQLADAMAGQVGAELALIDHVLQDVRATWQTRPAADPVMTAQQLDFLPQGLVSHLSLANAEGRLIYSSRGIDVGLDVQNQFHFVALHSTTDRMVVGDPVRPNADEEWMIPVGRPLYREGRFAGAIYLLISAERMGQRLKRLALDRSDVVVLANAQGKLLARSVDNTAAMGRSVPPDRPFMQEGAADSGSYWQNSAVDQLPRVFGWQRLPDSRAVVVVGLAESSVLAPVVSAMNRSAWVTAVLSLVLLAGGSAVAWLLWRVERSGEVVRETARRLKDAQRLAKVGHWTLDLRTRDFTWSDEVYRIMGMQRGVVGPSYSDVFQRVHPEDRAGFEEAFERAIKGGVRMDVAHRVVRPDGSVKHVHALGIFEHDNGEAVRCQGTVQDVTEVRAAQLAMEQLNDELEARVDARTRELASLNNELEAFTYSVSHDLRTPLRSIAGFASLLEEESESLSPEGRTHLRRIQDGARRMGLLITDLLTMAHHSRAEVHLQGVNLSELAQSVVSDIEREDPQRKVAWRIQPGLSAMADPVLLRVVLQNLLGNAWKYTSQTPHPAITLERGGQTGALVEFCVRDNGAGFDMAYVDQLFKPFKRLHAQHEFEGTGIGLASVQRLVQRHGGSVRAEGEVGRGATICFTLPEAPTASTFSEPPPRDTRRG